MVAEHEIPLMVAAYQHGLKVDAAKILAASVKMQTTPPQHDLPGGGVVGNENLESYLKYGYVAEDGPRGPGGAPQHAWDKPWSVPTPTSTPTTTGASAQLALALGRERHWRRSFSSAHRIGAISSTPPSGTPVRAWTNGDWVTPFDPYLTPGFVESDAWQYTWFVPQDVPGLVAAMGHVTASSKQLNDGFEKSAPQRFNGGGRSAVYHGNEPTMQVSWLFNWAGRALPDPEMGASGAWNGTTATRLPTSIWATRIRGR